MNLNRVLWLVKEETLEIEKKQNNEQRETEAKGNKDTPRKITQKWLRKTSSCPFRTLPTKYMFHFYNH